MGRQFEEPLPLPNAQAVKVTEGVTLQPPLSHRGHGPGLIIFVPKFESKTVLDNLDVVPLTKWAEEGYAVIEIQTGVLDISSGIKSAFTTSLKALLSLEECSVKDKLGAIVYDPAVLEQVQKLVAETREVVTVASYSNSDLWDFTKPHINHQSGSKILGVGPTGNAKVYTYPDASSPFFVLPGHSDYVSRNATIAHTRTLTFLKHHIGGPIFDLEAIWEKHLHFEFEDRSVARTMQTMVQEPYVNHIPTMTGGIGRPSLTEFYRHHFIWDNPEDAVLELISRTIGVDRIVDEFIFCFTHNREIGWLAPGIPPTNKYLRIPNTAIVNIRGDRLTHEHILWDQGSALVQMGLLPEWLPWPHALPEELEPADGKRVEFRVPALGAETARKAVDENSEPSNQMMNKAAMREID